MNSIKDLVESPHPIYQRYKQYFNFLLESYEGGVDYTNALIKSAADVGLTSGVRIIVNGKTFGNTANANLFQHPKERQDDYINRIRMSYYYNFCAPILEIYTNHLFKQPVVEDFGSIDYSVRERYEDIDLMGSSVPEFRKNMSELAQIYGHIFVISDMPSTNMPIYSLQDKIDNGVFPYLSFYHPQDVINWALDRFGRPYWVLVKDGQDINTEPFNIKKDTVTEITYRLWTRQEWITYDLKYNETGRGLHMLGYVPISCIFDKQSKKARNFLGVSTLADIAFISRDIYNSCSELKQILRDQTFAFLALQGSTDEYSEIEVGTSKGLLYPENRDAPQYISPPPANAEVYFSHIDRQVRKVFQLAKLEGASAQVDQSAIQQTGVAKAWDFNETNSALAKKAGSFEDGETKIWQMWAAWEGGEFDGSIQYPTEFSIADLKSEMDECEQSMRLNLGREFEIEVKKAIIKKKFSRMPAEQVDAMVAEMESNVGKSESGRLMDRLGPTFVNKFRLNADSAVKGG